MSLEIDQKSVYAPIRSRGTLWWKYAVLSAKDGHIDAAGKVSQALPQMVDDYLIPLYATSFRQATQEQPNADHLWMVHAAKIDRLRHWVPLVAQYELNGRQIFDLDDHLVTLLRQTDVGEATLEQWHAPYEAFYVRFGPQPDMRLPFEDDQFEYLEGAYVARTPFDKNGGMRLKFGFTTVKADGSGVKLPGYFIDILPHEQLLTIPLAVEAVLARHLAEVEDRSEHSEATRALHSYQRSEVNDSAALLRAGSKLLVNALFYLESIRASQSPPEPGRDTPVERVSRWLHLPDRRRHKEQSALSADGYAVVRLVGREASGEDASTSSVGVRAHWRRGHWRQQRHGAGLALLKRLWIKPVLVAGSQGDVLNLPGHVYTTDRDRGQP